MGGEGESKRSVQVGKGVGNGVDRYGKRKE